MELDKSRLVGYNPVEFQTSKKQDLILKVIILLLLVNPITWFILFILRKIEDLK